MNDEELEYSEEELREREERRRRRRIEHRKRIRKKKKRIRLIKKLVILAIFIILLLLILIGIVKIGKGIVRHFSDRNKTTEMTEVSGNDISGNDASSMNALESSVLGKEEPALILDTNSENSVSNQVSTNQADDLINQKFAQGKANRETKVFSAVTNGNTSSLPGEVVSERGILIDASQGIVVAGKGINDRIVPASMTKVLTVLVAAENIENLNDTFVINQNITDYIYKNDCSAVGFSLEEEVPVKDLFYGTILPSGADAALGLAEYVAGSEEAFVELMNKKLKELGMSDSAHVTNCTGLYDENHYCTVYDMAVIMEMALQNEFLKDVLSQHKYTTAKTTKHPDGIEISNWFLRRIEDKDCGGTVLAAKTGYVVQSGNCAVSSALDKNGKQYICVTANSTSGWRCIYDHVAIYKSVMGE